MLDFKPVNPKKRLPPIKLKCPQQGPIPIPITQIHQPYTDYPNAPKVQIQSPNPNISKPTSYNPRKIVKPKVQAQKWVHKMKPLCHNSFLAAITRSGEPPSKTRILQPAGSPSDRQTSNRPFLFINQAANRCQCLHGRSFPTQSINPDTMFSSTSQNYIAIVYAPPRKFQIPPQAKLHSSVTTSDPPRLYYLIPIAITTSTVTPQYLRNSSPTTTTNNHSNPPSRSPSHQGNIP